VFIPASPEAALLHPAHETGKPVQRRHDRQEHSEPLHHRQRVQRLSLVAPFDGTSELIRAGGFADAEQAEVDLRLQNGVLHLAGQLSQELRDRRAGDVGATDQEGGPHRFRPRQRADLVRQLLLRQMPRKRPGPRQEHSRIGLRGEPLLQQLDQLRPQLRLQRQVRQRPRRGAPDLRIASASPSAAASAAPGTDASWTSEISAWIRTGAALFVSHHHRELLPGGLRSNVGKALGADDRATGSGRARI